VPDEVTYRNASAIEVCEALGWFGDGFDHTADSPVIAKELGGRCNAHRYVYGVDLVDPNAGDGSLLVLDFPTVLHRQDRAHTTNPDDVVRTTGTPPPVLSETIDVAGVEMAQPLVCDSPSMPTRRVPLGSIGFGLQTSVPTRAITFAKFDPPTPNGRKGVRCVPWAPPIGLQVDGATVPEFADAIVDKSLFAHIDTAGLRADQTSYALGTAYDPRKPRGVFGLAALSNGSVAFVDVDDYDRLCRGPTTLGPNATGELTDKVVLRHHPRLSRLYTSDTQSIVNLTLQSNGVSFSTDQTTESGRANPHLLPFADSVFIQVSADSPFPLLNEAWSMTYEGLLPGYAGAAGTFQTTDQDPNFPNDPTKTMPAAVLLDPAGHFCRRGVQDVNVTEKYDDKAKTVVRKDQGGDVVQIVEAVTNDPSLQANCLTAFGAETDSPLSLNRDLQIGHSFENRVAISGLGTTFVDDKGYRVWKAAVDGSGKPTADFMLFKTCFPGLTRYVVRGNSSWVVAGSLSGYLHRRAPTDPTKDDSACTTDTNKSHVFQGRAYEVAHDPKITGVEPIMDFTKSGVTQCNAAGGDPLFVNPSVEFAIRSGTTPSRRDMQFAFGLRMSVGPLVLSLATLPTAIKPLSRWVNGVDTLDWQQVAVVDGVDKGLTIFSLFDLTNSKNFP
jgi:hypothetical protein